MRCIFRHAWIYRNKMEYRTSDEICKAYRYDKRFCSKCGKIQENDGQFTRVQEFHKFVDKWKTIGYLKKPSKKLSKKNANKTKN